GLFQRLVVLRGLIAVGDHIASQRGQDVDGLGFRRKRGHAGEGAGWTGNVDGRPVFGGGRRIVFDAAGGSVPASGFLIPCDQVQQGGAARGRSSASGIAGAFASVGKPGVHRSRIGIAGAVKVFSVRSKRLRAIAFGRARQSGPVCTLIPRLSLDARN